MSKPFMTTQQMIAHLMKKNLAIPNESEAEAVLMRHGYFSLINGYKSYFQDPATKCYLPGTTLNDILGLYAFDEALRMLFMQYLLKVERHMKTLISYYFSESYGEHQDAYLNPLHYQTGTNYKRDVLYLVNSLSKLCLKTPSDYAYIRHHQMQYNNVSLWVLSGAMTMGNVSKMYSVLTQTLQAKISKNFPSLNERQLGQVLAVITLYRNACAHGERLFSYQIRRDIPDFQLHQKLSISKKGSQYCQGKRDLFAVVIAFCLMLPKSELVSFKRGLSKLIDRYAKSRNAFDLHALLAQMGFPINWRSITRYVRD